MYMYMHINTNSHKAIFYIHSCKTTDAVMDEIHFYKPLFENDYFNLEILFHF